MKFTKKSLSVVIAGFVLTGLLSGCGSQSTSNGQSSTSASNTATTSNGSDNNPSGQQHAGQHHNGQGFVQALVNAGVSQSDAQSLAKLIQQTNTDPKWVMEQLKNKVSVSDITSEINNGKAPKRQWNGNHQPHSDAQHNQSDNHSSQSSTTAGGSGSNSN
ncbi:hypothetical protein DNHGIG_15350 [Collibacillus ludicampi]|uniref:DUF3597 domain-containing protein n=1 Tax=Collibacillus ludicampi TaxID=2771369 RepID=A0AAV4LE50_9BACL|nr:hypothetical protein [Collibacillus ludicampi]GIM45986.1 hypothetical protein DNHGIG_15350 [Collibacillus ludicampi]